MSYFFRQALFGLKRIDGLEFILQRTRAGALNGTFVHAGLIVVADFLFNGDYYQSCMDESAIESAGARPLQDEFKAIDALQSKQDLAEKVTHLHREGVGALFSFSSDQDFKDATQVIA